MYDTGVIYAGWEVRRHMMIPPKQKEWKTIGYCAAPCTEKVSGLPSNVFFLIVVMSVSKTKIAQISECWRRHKRQITKLREVFVRKEKIIFQVGDRALWFCSTNAEIRTADSESDLRICYSYNYDDNNYNSTFIMFVVIIIIIVMIIITIIVIVSLSSFVQDIALFYDIAVSR